MTKIKVGIVGATGYTGSELVRLLYHHQQSEIKIITSESKAGQKFSDIHAAFIDKMDITLAKIDDLPKFELDVVFLALPHGVAMNFVKTHHQEAYKIIDLSGDFRLSSPESYQQWYGNEHIFPEGFETASFGLPELFRDRIKQAKLIANPGCYPTSAILALYPLIKNKLIDQQDIIIDSKSGTTGAGIKPKEVTHFSNVNDNFKPYGLKTHRHTIEIQETLDKVSGNSNLVQFTPHLLPIDRGIISTCYSRPISDINHQKLQELYKQAYENEPFVRVRDRVPSVKDVKGSNLCDVFVTFDERTRRIITVSAIDNLVKGAAGQAVQNMNIMFDLDETAGLDIIPIAP